MSEVTPSRETCGDRYPLASLDLSRFTFHTLLSWLLAKGVKDLTAVWGLPSTTPSIEGI